jgi:hypothetical protein
LDPTGEFLFYAYKASIVQAADLSKEPVGVYNGEPTDSDEARYLQPRVFKINIIAGDDFVESWYFLAKLGRDHANEPVFITPRQSSHNQSRPELPFLLISLWKSKKNYLAFCNH